MEQLVTALRAIGEPTRLRILSLLSRGELTVSELVNVLGQSQPRVSRHIKLLASAGIIERLPEGTWVFYRLADHGRGQRIAQSIIALLDDADRVLARDLERLDAVKHARTNAANAYFAEVAKDWAHIRSLHLSEGSVETALREAAGNRHFKAMLDIGTGTGRMLEVFGAQTDQALGIDLSHEMLNLARLNIEKAGLPNCSVRHSDLYNLPFEDNKFDLVCVHQVLHYLDEPATALGEAVRVMAPGGLITIVDFAPHQLEFLREQHAHRRLGFTDTEMEIWMDQVGLSNITHLALRPDIQDAGANHLTVKIWTAERASTPAQREVSA
ncbi:MAG: ArsR family transcriptional regulator [Robiginitomaculum sp.]|nr:MAG: ArsR family transcriptional regulator [Robiginitomaculum sp.]